MVRQIARRVLGEEQSLEFSERIVQLERAVAGDGGDTLDSARALRSSIDGLIAKLEPRAFTADDLRSLVAGLVDDGASGQYRDYAGAEQATMAIASLLNFLGKRGDLADFRGINAALDQVYDTVKDDETYKPERFQAALAALGTHVKGR